MSDTIVLTGARTQERGRARWRLWPLLPIALAGGIACTVASYSMARHSTGHAHFSVFWLGFSVLLVALAVAGVRITRTLPALALLTVYGVITFLPKFLMSRNGPVFFDEFGHIRHANDIVATGRLDVPSSYLPIIKLYPGLEVLTAWLHDVTGLSTWHAGQLLILVSHCAVLCLVWMLARLAGLPRPAAFIAALVYSLNPSYMYFDTEYAYESLGLTLCFGAAVLAMAATRAQRNLIAAAWCAGASVTAGACIVTHHISALFMVLLLSMVAFSPPGLAPRPAPLAARIGPAIVALLAATGFGLWLSFVAPSTVDYISPHVRGGLRGVVEIVTGHSSGAPHTSARHQLFAGSDAPFYEKVFAYLAPLLAGLAVVSALAQAWTARRERARIALVAPFGVLALLYFLSLPLALTVDGGETAHRAWAYGYVGIAVLAGFSAPIWRRAWLGSHRWAMAIPGLAALIVVAIGNVAAGENVAYRFPGPYAFGSDTRAQTPELHELATWARQNLSPGAHVVTDRLTGEVITSETTLNVPSPSQSLAYGLYRQGDAASPSLRQFLAGNDFHYWILDLRIASQQPAGKLFQGYAGPASIDPAAVLSAGNSHLLTVIHRTDHYLVMTISP